MSGQCVPSYTATTKGTMGHLIGSLLHRHEGGCRLTVLLAHDLAHVLGISRQGASKILRNASAGKAWREHHLPVMRVDGIIGGRAGEGWGLMIDLCSPALCDLLGLSETLPSTTIEDRLQGRAEDWQIAIAADKCRILTPVLLTRPGSSERAAAIRELAAQPVHQVGGTWLPVAERTLYDWLSAAEGDVSGLLPASRSDRGQRRVRISRA